MALNDFLSDSSEEKTASDGYCPECEKKGEETEHWYWRCATPRDKCPVLTFIPANTP